MDDLPSIKQPQGYFIFTSDDLCFGSGHVLIMLSVAHSVNWSSI